MIDYKKLIKGRNTRVKILKMFDWISDERMLKIQYYIKMGRKLNLQKPERFSEKIQWYKLYYKDPLMATCADKFEVREYVRSKGYDKILIPCYGVFDNVDDIKFSDLPTEYVLKDTLGGGGDSVKVISKSYNYDVNELKKICKKWIDKGLINVDPGREWVYCVNKHRVIIEKKLEIDPRYNDLLDYKFFCFNGRCEFLYVIGDRELGNGAGLSIFNRSFEKINAYRCDERRLNKEIEKPLNFDEMIQIAERLSINFPEVRVDLYDVCGKIYFGEMTFFDGSGYMKYEPDNFDYVAGKYFLLPEKRI